RSKHRGDTRSFWPYQSASAGDRLHTRDTADHYQMPPLGLRLLHQLRQAYDGVRSAVHPYNCNQLGSWFTTNETPQSGSRSHPVERFARHRRAPDRQILTGPMQYQQVGVCVGQYNDATARRPLWAAGVPGVFGVGLRYQELLQLRPHGWKRTSSQHLLGIGNQQTPRVIVKYGAEPKKDLAIPDPYGRLQLDLSLR